MSSDAKPFIATQRLFRLTTTDPIEVWERLKHLGRQQVGADDVQTERTDGQSVWEQIGGPADRIQLLEAIQDTRQRMGMVSELV